MGDATDRVEQFIAAWRDTGGSELANTQSFVNGLCEIIGVSAPDGSRADDSANDYVFERRVFADNGDGTRSFGRIDCYRRGAFILEAKQGSDADRRAAEAGEDDLDLFGQTAARRMKRGTARRGTDGWTAAMIAAKGQAERYARALPTDHEWPPFLIVTDVGYCLDIWADFSGTGRAYTQFPDRARYRVMLEDLRDPKVRERLRAIWTDPASLDPAARAARVTRQIADLLATVARRLEARGHNAERVSGFLMRLLFTMFAEDSGLIPEGSFTQLLKSMRARPEHLAAQLTALWQAMDKGEFAPALGQPLRRFNGYLFKDRTAIDLDGEELVVLIQAAEHRWTEVEPAIFGTLLERALNPKERAKLGAHYTPRAYVERLIAPTLMEPLRADWDVVRTAAALLIEDGKTDAARLLVEQFHGKLAATKVLDPACGTGNFLYVALARMKELEGEVLDVLEELGDRQYVADLTGHTITPENFLGLEINERAVEIAQLVLWIGYLQWHFRVNGAERMPGEPILTGVRTIKHTDALIDWADKVLERGENGQPMSIWDGISFKRHPVTDRLIPDETGRKELYRYIKPTPAKWPAADFIVGNPPFIGNKRMRERLGDGYTEAVRSAYPKVSESVDFVMYWWDIASRAVGTGKTRRLGFITTNSITQVFNRSVIEQAPAELAFAIPDHPWVDGTDGADVRIAMTVASRAPATRTVAVVRSEALLPDGYGESMVDLVFDHPDRINSDLSGGVDVTIAKPLKANAGISQQGVILVGEGFRLTEPEGEEVIASEPNSVARVRPYLIGRDLTQRRESRLVIDTFGLSERELATHHPRLFQLLDIRVRPFREQNRDKAFRENWWLWGRPRPEIRALAKNLSRVIVTCRTAKHRIFSFENAAIVPDAKIIFVGLDDALFLGVLSSHIHGIWARRTGGWLGVGNDSNYNHSDCFGKFPFAAEMSEPLAAKIRDESEALDALRKRVLAEHDDLTMTRLYNVLEALRAGRILTDAERDIHDRGLVTLIRRHHNAIDAAVAEAYGWRADHESGLLTEDEVLARLVALNRERAAEEAHGVIRYLRPEFQQPGYAPPVSQTLDLGEATAPLPDNVIPWPAELPAQIASVHAILAAASVPLAPQDIARAYRGKRAATVRPVLEALAGVGLARRTGEGKYAA